MRDFIMKRLSEEIAKENDNSIVDEIAENEAILECAHLISELDDLTVEGTELNQFRDIDAVNIPIDDDGVIDTLEVCITNGTISDIPADILVHSESYEYMLGVDDFVQEAYNDMPRKFMEDDDQYAERVNEAAETKYNEYLETIVQEGLFSANKVHLGDPSVRWSVNANFGPSDPSNPSSAPFVKTLDIGYVPSNGRDTILVKQRDSIAVLCDGHPEIFRDCAQWYIKFYEENGIKIPKGQTLFDVMIPRRVIVPVEPVDKFDVVVEAENVLARNKDEDFYYMEFSIPIKARRFANSSSLGVTTPVGSAVTANATPHVSLKGLIDKTGFLKECYREKTPIGRLVQEAIDFGNGGDDANAGGDTTTDSGVVSGGTDLPPESGNGTETPAAVDDTQATGDATENNGAVEIPSNDISGDIASDVQNTINDQTNPETPSTDNELNTAVTDIPEDSLNENPDIDTSGLDDTSNGSVDDALKNLDDAGMQNSDVEPGVTNSDTSSMSMEEIKQAAIDKISKMPMDQVQAFLNDDDSEGMDDTGAVTEAFILTPKNINAELDVCLRKALGDLNDDKKDLSEIVSAFKKDGKKLNRALSKASKMVKVYSETDIKQFIKLNKCVADLVVSLKGKIEKSEVKVIKRLIKAFTSQAVVVGKIIDNHKNDKEKQPDRVVD